MRVYVNRKPVDLAPGMQVRHALIAAGQAGSVISGPGVNLSPGSGSVSFEVSQKFPLLSITSMLAPSPDWFVGTDSLNLRQDGRWIDELTVDLPVYDAGTDSGSDFTSNNANTDPAELITQINEGSLGNGVPVGQFRLQLQSVSDYFPIGGEQSGVYYDRARDGEGVILAIGRVGERLVFSATWFTYNNGEQMWLVGSTDLQPDADLAEVDLFSTTGANFGAAFDPLDVVATFWGTATFRFPDCGLVELDYDDGDQQTGHLEMETLVDISGASCE